MVVTDLIRAACVAFVATGYLLGILESWMLLVITLIISTAEAFRGPASTALTPKVLEERCYEYGMALNSSMSTLVQLLGLAFAGGIIAWIGSVGAIYVDMATFLLSAGIIALVRVKEENLSKEKFDGKEYKETLRAGIVYVRQSPVLIWIISASLFLNAMLVPFNSLQAPLASDVLHRGAEALSLLGITVTLGMLLGSAVYPMVQKRILSRSILALAGMGIFIFYVGIVICQPMYTSLWGTYLTLSVLSVIFGCTISIAISMISVQFMKWTEESYLARVGGIFNALSVAAMPVTSFLISAVVAFVDIKILFLAVGVIDFIGCIFMVRSKALKQMDEEEQSTVSYTGETE